jgi:predicted TIM-barrel fold metal-dependent hydrolase
MVFTGFSDAVMPFPRSATQRLIRIGDRILFGSDFPNIPHGYVEALAPLTRLDGVDDAWLRGVLHDNAADLFGLPHS